MTYPVDIGGLHEEQERTRSARLLGNLQEALAGELVRLPHLADLRRSLGLHEYSSRAHPTSIELIDINQDMAESCRDDANGSAYDNGHNRPHSIEPTLPLPAFLLGSMVVEVAVGPAGESLDRAFAGRLVDGPGYVAECEKLAHVAVFALAAGRPGEHVEYAVGRVPATLLDGEQIRERLLELRVQLFHALSFLAFASVRGFYHRDVEVMT